MSERPSYREVESKIVQHGVPRKESANPSKAYNRLAETSFGMLASLFLVRSQDSPNDRLILYEFVMPYLSKSAPSFVEQLTSENARVPLMLLIIGCTAAYQLYIKPDAYCKKKQQVEPQFDKDEPKSIVNELRRKAAKRGKITPKMEADMARIEAMMGGLDKFSQSVTG